MKEAVVTGLALVLSLTLIPAGTTSSMDGHAIGDSGAAGGAFPVMGWSRDAGDLRVAHFFATHALHFIPAFALGLTVIFKSIGPLPIRFFTIGFVAFVIWTFVQALMGYSFLPGIG